MARAETLAILARVVDRLRPLAGKTPGQPLRSDDWNQVVTAVTELADLVARREDDAEAQLDARYARAEHRHKGEITLAWFDPEARTLVESATTGSVEQTAGLARLNRELDAHEQRVEELAQRLENLSGAVEGVRGVDVKRERDIGRIAVDLENARAVDTRVTALANQLGGFDESRRIILAFRDSLRDPNGEPLDLNTLNDRLTQVDDLRDRLTLANGEIVRVRELEARIDRIGEREVPDVPDRPDVGPLVRELLADPAFFTEETRGALIGPLRNEFLTRDTELGGRVDAADAAVADMRGRLDGSAQRIEELSAGLDGAGQRLTAATAAVSQVDALAERVTVAEATAAEARAGLAEAVRQRDELSTRMEDVSRQLTEDRAVVAAARADIDRLSQSAGSIAGLESAVTQLQTGRATSDQQLQGLLQRQDAADLQISGLDTRLRDAAGAGGRRRPTPAPGG